MLIGGGETMGKRVGAFAWSNQMGLCPAAVRQSRERRLAIRTVADIELLDLTRPTNRPELPNLATAPELAAHA